jgi:glycosyltransferase involved in cell wall biosynthesis
MSIPVSALTISIPAYNDAPTIRSVVEQSLAAAAACCAEAEVLVINDGSRDDTAAVVEKLCRELPGVQAIHHPRNLGFGPTIRKAYLHPRSDWVVFLPGDGQIPPSAIATLWAAKEGFDLVLARRRDRRDPLNRRLVSWCYNRLVSVVAGARIHDVNGTALVRREVLERIRLESHSAFVHAELVLKALCAGARYCEREIDHLPRVHGAGSGNRLDVVWGTFKDLLRYWLGGRGAMMVPPETAR